MIRVLYPITRTTYPTTWLARFRDLMVRDSGPRIEGTHSTATGTAGYFVDPEDGIRYRVTVEPVSETEGL